MDVGTGSETVTLTVLHGRLTTGTKDGLTGLTGNGTGSVSFTGTLAQINAALNWLSYQGSLNFSGADTLTIISNANRNTGAGGPLTTTNTVAITVTAVDDAPVYSVPAA